MDKPSARFFNLYNLHQNSVIFCKNFSTFLLCLFTLPFPVSFLFSRRAPLGGLTDVVYYYYGVRFALMPLCRTKLKIKEGIV